MSLFVMVFGGIFNGQLSGSVVFCYFVFLLCFTLYRKFLERSPSLKEPKHAILFGFFM